MAVSKRLRFEILRRDNHACRYCGRTAPEVPLTVDHVIPVALGGTDDPENLAAACADCNSGKSSIPVGSEIVADVAADALRWGRAMQAAADLAQADRDVRYRRRAEFLAYWDTWTFKIGGRMNQTWPLPGDWGDSIDTMIAAGATLTDFEEAVDVALGRRGISDRWTYFCGVVWKILGRRQQVAREILNAENQGGAG